MTARSLPSALAEDVSGGGLNAANVGITRRFGGGKTTESKVIEALGENTLVTPQAEASITLYWIALETSEENASEVLAEVKLGTQTPYTWYLGKPGAFMHWEPVVGAVGVPLVVKLSVAVKVAVNFTYTEG